MKKRICLLLVLVLALGLFAGCTHETVEPDPMSTTGADEPATAEPTETSEPLDAPEQMPPMWRVTDDEGHTLYLFGTIHAGDTRSSAVLVGLAPTLDTCDALAVEFDVVAFESDMGAAAQALSQFVYTDGTTVADHLSEEQYASLVEILSDAGVYLSYLDYYNLAMWMQTAEQAFLMRYSALDFDMAMDSLLINNAYEREMEVLEVESADFQYGLLNSFPEELYLLEIDALLQTDGEEYGQSLDALYEAWVTGDLDALNEMLLEEDDPSELSEQERALIEQYNRQMLDERNLGMRDRATEYLESGKTVFFAVGSAHMLGQAGLVQLLTDAGYTVERIS